MNQTKPGTHLLCIAFVQIGQEMALSGNSLLTPCPREMLKNGVYVVNLSGNLSVFAILKKKKTSGGNSLVFVILMICVGAPPFQSPATELKNKKNKKRKAGPKFCHPPKNGPNTDLPVPVFSNCKKASFQGDHKFSVFVTLLRLRTVAKIKAPSQ